MANLKGTGITYADLLKMIRRALNHGYFAKAQALAECLVEQCKYDVSLYHKKKKRHK